MGDQLVQQRQTLRCQLGAQVAHAREVAARPIQAGDKAKFDRVEAHEEYDRNGGGGRLGGHGRRTIRDNHRYLTLNQIGRQCRQPIVLPVCPAIFDG
jgi:hypothetical protein